MIKPHLAQWGAEPLLQDCGSCLCCFYSPWPPPDTTVYPSLVTWDSEPNLAMAAPCVIPPSTHTPKARGRLGTSEKPRRRAKSVIGCVPRRLVCPPPGALTLGGAWSRLETEVGEWPQFWWWEDLLHAFHTPDKHLIVGPREAGSGWPCISNNNDADDDSSHLLSARHLAACVARLVSPVVTAASLEGGSQ